MTRRIIQPGERLAIKPDVIQSGVVKGQKAMWWDMWTSIPPNERVGADGSIAVVHIRGALDHHEGYGADSYEAIRGRVEDALSGKDDYEKRQRARQEYIWTHRYDDGFVPPEECTDSTPPSAIVLRIDSPGGVVSGLNETVRALRETFNEAGIPSVAFVDELCASAAYAISCSCDEVITTESAISGSIGVIACMYDQVEADKKAGINVVTITSGARKADGHPHVAVSDAAVAAEQHRVDRSAKAFWRIVSEARGLSPKVVKSYEAGIFQGTEAVEKGLADAVSSWEDLVATLSADDTPNAVKQKRLANGGQTEPGLTGTTSAKLSTRKTMTVTLKHRVKKTEAALAAEKDPKRRKALSASLALDKAALSALAAANEASKKTKIKYEESTEESSEEEEEAEAEESEEESESSEEEEEASGNETDRDEEAEPADDDDESDDDEDAAAAAPKKAKAALALIERQTGKRGAAALGAAAAMFGAVKRAEADIAQLKAAARTKEKGDLIAKATRYVPKSQLAWLKGQSLAVVRGFVEQATKGSPIVHTEEGELLVPKAAAPGTEASLSKDVVAQIDAATAACPANIKKEDFRKALVDAHLAEHKKRLAAATNGVGRA